MKSTFSKRLKNARTIAMLSQDELVFKMDNCVSKNAISKYEKGEMLPTSEVLIKISEALNVKPEYFYRSYDVSISGVEFRKRKSLGVRRINSIKQKAVDFIERYIEIEELLNISIKFKNPIEKFSINSSYNIEAVAEKLLMSWKVGLNAIPSVYDVLEANNVKVFEVDEEMSFDGVSGYANEYYPFIIVNKKFSTERKRLTALHELGHLLLNFSDKFSEKEIENLCYRFAGAILFPEKTMKLVLGSKRHMISSPELVNIKEKYGISIQAIMRRAKEIEIISNHQYTQFQIRISKNRKEVGLGAFEPVENPNRFNQLVFRAVTEEIISMSKAADLFNMKLGDFTKEYLFQ